MARDFYEKVCSALFGVAVGDALGVPVEFLERAELQKQPVCTMLSGGAYGQPAGTWSDDSSLTFCLAESLCEGFNLNHIAQNCLRYIEQNHWTPYGEVFDIGIATSRALIRFSSGISAELCGDQSEFSNGNGSLMRILPLVFYIKDLPIDERFNLTRKVSSITHGHIRSIIACFYYLEFARYLLLGEDKYQIYARLQQEIPQYLNSLAIESAEINLFYRLFGGDIAALSETEIASSGYVLHTLEASIWCLLNSHNYSEAVLKAVNLADDSDTTGAVTGGLAGILYGMQSIPNEWINVLARKEDIEQLAFRLAEKCK